MILMKYTQLPEVLSFLHGGGILRVCSERIAGLYIVAEICGNDLSEKYCSDLALPNQTFTKLKPSYLLSDNLSLCTC